MEIGRKLKKLHEIENCHSKLVVAELGEVFLHFRYPIVQRSGLFNQIPANSFFEKKKKMQFDAAWKANAKA